MLMAMFLWAGVFYLMSERADELIGQSDESCGDVWWAAAHQGGSGCAHANLHCLQPTGK